MNTHGGIPPARCPRRFPADEVRRVMVVDDDGGIRKLNAAILNRSGYEVKTANDGAAAWEELDAGCYDLLLTDHAMPGLTGLELIKRLRSAQRAIPVILMSGTMPLDELSRHPCLRIEAMLFKPFTCDELLIAVNGVMGANEENREAVFKPGGRRFPQPDGSDRLPGCRLGGDR